MSTSLPASLINAERVSVGFGLDPVLEDVSLGVSGGDRIGIVGRNGGGKSTLVSVLAGLREPDSGRVSRTGGVSVGVVRQADDLDETGTEWTAYVYESKTDARQFVVLVKGDRLCLPKEADLITGKISFRPIRATSQSPGRCSPPRE